MILGFGFRIQGFGLKGWDLGLIHGPLVVNQGIQSLHECRITYYVYFPETCDNSYYPNPAS